ncbi:MAG: hypothetical protein CMB97_00080 [Flavobacteriaceae bacterium]|nr:hypothetical protein [Flavobacteriaceae bacterium]
MIIGFPNKATARGGPGSFQTRISMALKEQGWKIVYPEDNILPDVILVVAGTRKLNWLRKCKKKGVRIVHRLDGLWWSHRIRPCSLRKKIVAEICNWISRIIRHVFADVVIYQSHFVKDWWHRKYGKASCEETVIYNAVNLSEFYPRSDSKDKSAPRLLCIGSTMLSSPPYIQPPIFLSKRLCDLGLISKTVVYGDAEKEGYDKLSSTAEIELAGILPREKIPQILQNAVFLVLEVNSACPNAVIESLAAGIPVIGFDTGALKELVPPEAGVIVPYGADYWKLEMPDLESLEKAAIKVLKNWQEYSDGARKFAEERFGLDKMVEKYISLLLPEL